MPPRPIRVEVVYALSTHQVVLVAQVTEGGTVKEAIKRSGILGRFPEIDLARVNVGIFGRKVRLESRVMGGERIEIYRPLIADPKEVRQQRARHSAKAMKHR